MQRAQRDHGHCAGLWEALGEKRIEGTLFPPSITGCPQAGLPSHLGWEQGPQEAAAGDHFTTLAEVGEDVVLLETGSGRMEWP